MSKHNLPQYLHDKKVNLLCLTIVCFWHIFNYKTINIKKNSFFFFQNNYISQYKILMKTIFNLKKNSKFSVI